MEPKTKNGTARAVLAAGVMIAAAIYFKPNPEPLRFIPLDSAPRVRFDAATGAFEVCRLDNGRWDCDFYSDKQ